MDAALVDQPHIGQFTITAAAIRDYYTGAARKTDHVFWLSISEAKKYGIISNHG